MNLCQAKQTQSQYITTWTTFIQEICDSSQQNQNICENNLKVLKLLSEEIFDFSKNQITSTQITELKASLNSEFGKIFQLCFFLLTAYATQSQQMKLSLIKQNMDTLYTYLSWMPSVYIFQTELVEALIQLFDSQQLRNQAIKCLTEIVTLPLESEPQILQLQQQKILLIFQNFTLKVKQVFSYDYGFTQERQRLKQSQNNTQLQLFDDFCHLLTLYFTAFLQTHLNWLETIAKDNQQAIQLIEISLMYIVNFTALPDEQNYKVCAEFWNEFTKKLLNQKVIPVQNNQLILNIYGGEQQQSLTATVYPKIFIDLRRIIISKMAKPQEVLISIDESGQPYKEELVNTENNAMYELLKELLINLAKINWFDTKNIILVKLDKQVVFISYINYALKMALLIKDNYN
ncbi:Exportin-1 [Paramecium bursaria]